jgi:Lon protease-like protein
MPDLDMIAVFAMIGPFSPQEKQALLETAGLTERADLVLALAEIALARAADSAPKLQ